MSFDCIPITAIPHSSKLFQDYLGHIPQVADFYPHPPTPQAIAKYARELAYPAERREQVAEILLRQNRLWGAGDATLQAIEHFRAGAVAVVSGQQVGLFGGPLYSLLKAASAIQLARELTAKGIEAVPVFWLATEDHDLPEVNESIVPERTGDLKHFASTTRGRTNSPVGDVRFPAEIEALAREAADLLGESDATQALLESYREGETFGSAFAKLFSRLFHKTGLILIDPLDPGLHAVAGPLLLQAAERAEEIDAALLHRGQELHKRGYHEQVKVTPASTTLFTLEGGERTVLHLADGGFMIGARAVSRAEILKSIAERPDLYSPNVLLRPLVQDYLLPTVAYFGGPAEIAYFAQVATVYQKLLGRVTPVLPRLSLTVINSRMERLLHRYGIQLPDLFHGTECLCETLARKVLPPSTQQSFEDAAQTVEKTLARLQKELSELDPTLVESADKARKKMLFQVSRLGKRAARAELRRNERICMEAMEIEGFLFPDKGLQERTIAGVYFLAMHGPELLERFVEVAAQHCPGHQLLRI